MAEDKNGLPQVEILARDADMRSPLQAKLAALAKEMGGGGSPKLILLTLDGECSSDLFINNYKPHETASAIHALAQQTAMACEHHLARCDGEQRFASLTLSQVMRGVELAIAAYFGFEPRGHS